MKRRFRGSIYVDVFIDSEDDLEEARGKAGDILTGIVNQINCYDISETGEAYVGGVGLLTGDLAKPLDREI